MELTTLAITVIVILFAIVCLYQCSSKSKQNTVPGLEPSTIDDGNNPDILREGGLHQFLMKLHKEFGDIASFYFGRQYCVSICSPELFQEHQGVFDRPPELFRSIEYIIGQKSLQYANEKDGQTRRNRYDKAFSHVKIKQYFAQFHEGADAVVQKWSTFDTEEHIPLHSEMLEYALRMILLALFHDRFTEDTLLEFRKSFSMCWSHMEKHLSSSGHVDSDEQDTFENALVTIRKIMKRAIRQRKENPPGAAEEILLDIFIESTADEETLLSDAIGFVLCGSHTTSNLLTWCLYFLATHEEVQDKVYNEIKTNLGGEDVDHTNINYLVYIRQVLDETLRCSALVTWAARFQDIEAELGGYKIPKTTPVIHALGVSLQDEKLWPQPKKFDPDRFSTDNVQSRPRLAFQPFGFAGKRVCPGYRFAYADTTVLLASLIKKFKVNLVEGQDVKPLFGLVTRPQEEIWIKIETR